MMNKTNQQALSAAKKDAGRTLGSTLTQSRAVKTANSPLGEGPSVGLLKRRLKKYPSGYLAYSERHFKVLSSSLFYDSTCYMCL